MTFRLTTTRLLHGSVVVVALTMAGCSHLPVDGPNYRDVTTGATTTLAVNRDAIGYDYALIDIDADVLANLATLRPASLFQTFGARNIPVSGDNVAVGDVIQVSIFESTSGGLFAPVMGEAGNANRALYATLPQQTVTASGRISIPYAGEVRVAGRRVTEIERTIEEGLASRSIEPQVVLTVLQQNSRAVSVVGDTLNGANRFKLESPGERVLDMISRAGGLRFPGYELYVTLQRQGRRATIYFPRLIADPSENLYVWPGDTIYVSREPHKFVAIGALGNATQTSGLTGQFTFDQERLSLNEALAKAGGLADARANPSEVFLYRLEYRSILEEMGADLRKFSPEQKLIPTIYRANFRDPSAFFLASKFEMRDKDIIYASNSDATEISKFLDFVRGITSTVAGVSVDTVTTEDVLVGRHVLGN